MLVVSNVSKRYGKAQILKDISLSVEPGQIVSLVGRNGCGKSTLLKILSGIIKPDSGSVKYYGHEAIGHNKVFAKYAGYVPQDNPLMEELSVKDNLKLWNNKKEIDDYILDDFELRDILNKKVSTLSGGMKRRLSIASTLITKPPVLILDEPTSSLDIYYQNSIMSTLLDFKNNNGMVIMSTHNEAEIMLSDKCYLYNEGSVICVEKDNINMDEIRKYFLITDK